MKKGLQRLVITIWLVNLCLLGMGASAYVIFNNASAQPAIPATSTDNTPRASNTPRAGSGGPQLAATRRATMELWPTPTMGPSVTPLPMPARNLTYIGSSVENRPLEVYSFGTGSIAKLIVAGIHGGYEHNTVELAEQLIYYINENPQVVPVNVKLYILRNLNPDGYARAQGVDGRVNANGVDLNRNWPYNWKENWSRDGCWIWRPVTGGEYGGSEPEVQALIGFIDSIKPATLLSYHSAALGIFPGGRPDFPPSIRLAEAVADVTDYPYPPIDTGCDYTGNLTDWAANTRGIPSIDIELTNHRDTDFEQNLRVLQVFLNWEK